MVIVAVGGRQEQKREERQRREEEKQERKINKGENRRREEKRREEKRREEKRREEKRRGEERRGEERRREKRREGNGNEESRENSREEKRREEKRREEKRREEKRKKGHELTAYIESKSITHVQRRFRNEFNVPRDGRIPSRNTILKWTQSEKLNLSLTSMCRSLQEDLRFHPYKIQIVNYLYDTDKPVRLAFYREFSEMLNADSDIQNKLIMSDEAHFHLSEFVNKQNFRYWTEDQSIQVHEQPLHSEKVTVWCDVSDSGIIGPYLLEERYRTVTVNADRCQEMLGTVELPEMDHHNEFWFQQDGATAHTARESMNCLQILFPGCIISRFGDITWPPRFPDFFLWVYLKSKVYCNRPHTIIQLKENINNEIRPLIMMYCKE
ncbi:hypothetical protein ANN_21277 [Periplaneta americana]|uniref:DUF4817 domain-containing protein n=1 Tax=Periplaneta americana TaxID=6978 RepID=A0ABQ8SEV9_PERAM|nr:hypothetical protein ANN_21277 [Periplaneta americana]